MITEEQKHKINELYLQGNGYKHIAKVLGTSRNETCYYIKKQKLNRPSSVNQYCKGDAEQSFKEGFNETYKGRYVYVGGYKGCDGKYTMKCLVCGNKQERSANGVRHKKNIECS